MKYYWQKQNRSEERKILRRSAVQEEDVAIRITHITVAAVVIYRLSFHACTRLHQWLTLCQEPCKVPHGMVTKHGPCPWAACIILPIKEKFSNAFEEQSVDVYFLKHLR